MMKPETKSKLEGVLGYPFFQSVGKTLPASVTAVNGWSAAAKMCRSHKWETCQLMARNALQGKIEARYPEDTVNHSFWHRFQEWNPIVTELRPLVHSFIDGLLPQFPLQDKALKNVKDAISWDIMFICLEYEYRDIVKSFFFVPVVEPWYAAGHFPCGWDGDEFPDSWDGIIRGGQLMVF
jgi:hypothetical protein